MRHFGYAFGDSENVGERLVGCDYCSFGFECFGRIVRNECLKVHMRD